MSSQIRSSETLTRDYTNVDFTPCATIDRVERFGLAADAGDGRLQTQLPMLCLIPDVLDVLVPAHPIRLVDTSNFELVHRFDTFIEFEHAKCCSAT